MDVVKSIKPDAFERLCQRILSVSGISDVDVLGKSGDGGIDGIGFLHVDLITFKIYFQCKRYTDNKVGPGDIREFIGALQSRAGKGVFITTSFFTKSAKEEAERGGLSMDLIDGYKLCDLLRKYKLGIEIVEQVKIKPQWFDRFNIESPQVKETKEPAKQKESKKRSPFNFNKSEIREGSIITFFNEDTQDEDKARVAIVTGDREIEFEGRRGTLSGFAQEFLERKSLRGPDYWKFENETLTERRDRMRRENKKRVGIA